MASTAAPSNERTGLESEMHRIRALLAKAESTTFPAEAEAIMAKVSELVARSGIDEALLWADAPERERVTPVSATVLLDAPYAARKAVLVNEVAAACGCQSIRSNGPGSSQTMTIVGFPGDVERAELLSTSLLVQMTVAMLAETPDTASPSRTASWRRSFIIGFASRVGERLRADRASAARDIAHRDDEAATDSAEASTSRSTALVLVDRDEAVASAFKTMFPRVRTTYMRSGGSASGSRAGERAADAADIGSGRLGGSRAALGS